MPAEPRPAAATLILSRDARRILMVRRSADLRFMGGHHAFPGGRIDREEGVAHVEGAPDAGEARAIHAAAREAFEETGLLLVRGSVPERSALRKARLETLERPAAFDEMLQRHELTIQAGDFSPAGLWITPELSPIRFHTRYYLHRLERAAEPELIAGELDEVRWRDAGAMRRRWREGSVRLSPPVAYALRQIERVPYPGVLAPLRRTTHLSPSDPGRMEFASGVHMIPLRTPTLPPATHTNCVAIGEREVFVIDPSTPDAEEQERLARQLEFLVEEGGRIAGVLLTHAHPDHTGAAQFVRGRFGAPVFAHSITAGRVDFPIDRHLEDGEILTSAGEPDWRIRCLHTPGHDPGHLCYLEETTRTLAAGDMVADGGTVVILADDGGDMTAYLESLNRLLGEPIDLIVPGHGFVIGNPRKKLQGYLDHRLERERQIRAALESGIRSTGELLDTVYGEVPDEVRPLAEQTLKAHLIRLGVSADA